MATPMGNHTAISNIVYAKLLSEILYVKKNKIIITTVNIIAMFFEYMIIASFTLYLYYLAQKNPKP